MIKIYLDWNVISYLKEDRYRDLYDSIIRNNDKFIFPYTRAHLQDLYVSKSPENEVKFTKDINTLTSVCGNHFLDFNEMIDSVFPYKAYPDEFIKKENAYLQLYKKHIG